MLGCAEWGWGGGGAGAGSGERGVRGGGVCLD